MENNVKIAFGYLKGAERAERRGDLHRAQDLYTTASIQYMALGLEGHADLASQGSTRCEPKYQKETIENYF